MDATDTKIFNSEWTKTPSGRRGLFGNAMKSMLGNWPPKPGLVCLVLDTSSRLDVGHTAMALIALMTSDEKADLIMRTLFGDEWAMSDEPTVEEALSMVQATLRKREGK